MGRKRAESRASSLALPASAESRECKPRTTGLRPWLCPVEYDPRLRWMVSTERLLHRVAGSPEHSPRSNRAGWGTHRFLMTESEQGSSPRLPRSDKEEQAKCALGPSVSTPMSYPDCSIRIGAYARGVLWYGVNPRMNARRVTLRNLGEGGSDSLGTV